jgi:hypothetical protein
MTKRTRTVLWFSGIALLVALAVLLLWPRRKPAPFEPERLSRAGAQGSSITEFIKVKVFYLTETSLAMRPVYREIQVPEMREELYRTFVSLLLSGDSGHTAPVPAGTQLRSLHYLAAREMLVLDFNELLAAAFPGGTTAELEFIYFMVDNICYNFREIKKVKFLVGGNESKTLAGHVDLEKPFFPNFDWLKDE